MSDSQVWKAVDHYLSDTLQEDDAVLSAVLKANREAGLPAIDVSPNQGKLLYLLAKLKGAKNILEIGTLGGYSSIWMGRALPEKGRLVTLEHHPAHAKIANENIKIAGLESKVEVIEGLAIESLSVLQQTNDAGFDLIFIDADKPNNPHYLRMALELANPGALIIGDNIVREGKVIEENSEDPNIQGVRGFLELLAEDSRIESTAIQTVGEKGYDGFVLGVVKA
ncbi:O-methyltransferase [Cytobacillus purgationiresistens]|uniref:O-methyltransferase YrrM n=1 Tax=Cytobacillus purgationiresistens TaxID=863449 RepID=A0ABU0AJB9_9BACI|nr:O-methyltransferase [Cytobacillus purgationiresistens]MDQ0271366.1 putative O-methyltransferase YrrM [Cytobacillus purgationiresistens]